MVWIVVARLVDLDGTRKRYGVHWRDRGDRRGEGERRRWVIVSADAPPWVLAHELGHWFGLAHSRAPGSVMNKVAAPGRPPPSRWRWTQAERAALRRRAAVHRG